MADVDIKTFVPAELKKKYQRLCLEEDTKMSTDLRGYIERRCNGVESANQVPELLKFLSATQKPTKAEIVKAAARFGIDTEQLMQICDRLFSQEKCGNGHE